MTTIADQLRLLLPPVSYDGAARVLSAAIEAEANALSASTVQADAAYSAMFPDSAVGLEDWERLLALPDRCLKGESQSIGQRVQAVVSKYRWSGGQSKAFFIGLAKSLGYDITITTFKPAYAGLAVAGDPVYGENWRFTWRVNAPSVTVSFAQAGIAGAGDPLSTWGNKSLECRLRQFSPAESVLLFGYGES